MLSVYSLLASTHTIMQFRHWQLSVTLDCLQQHSVHLVACIYGAYDVAGNTDDLGSYFFIPYLAYMFDLPLDSAINLFYNSLIWSAFILGSIGSLLYFKPWVIKMLAVVFIYLLLTTMPFSDVYIVGVFATISILPLFLYFSERNKKLLYYLFLLFAGVIIASSHYVRSYSSFAVLLIVVWFIYFNKQDTKKVKLLSYVSLIAGLLTVVIFFTYLFNERDQFIVAKNPNFDFSESTNSHSLWHSAYIGLGYYSNPEDIRYDDTNAYEKAQSVNPDVVYMSVEYDAILKQAYFNFAIKYPVYVLTSSLRKLYKILFSIQPFYLFPGLILAIIFTRNKKIELGIWLAMLFATIPGVIVIPYAGHVSSFTSLAFIYSLIGYNRVYLWLVTRNRMS